MSGDEVVAVLLFVRKGWALWIKQFFVVEMFNIFVLFGLIKGN